MALNRIALALGAGVLAVGAVGASANGLGGLRAVSVGADQSVVAACDSDGVDLDYTVAYDAASGVNKVTEVKLGDLAAPCAGQVATVTLASASATVAVVSATVAGATQTLTLVSPVDISTVAKAALVISG